MIGGLKPYPAYKTSGLLWLETVPAHWDMVPNRALMQEQRKVVGKTAADHTLLSLTLRGVIARDMEKPKGKFPAQFNSYKVVRPNDCVFCLFDIDETPRGVGLSSLRGMITGAYDVFSPRPRVDPRFLYYHYLFIDEGKLMKPLYTGLRKTIQRGAFASLKAPRPSPDEQVAIVRFLDHANRKIDGFIRAKRKLIALLNEQKQAIIHRAVTRGLNANAPLKPSGIRWLGDIPKHWNIAPLGRLCAARCDGPFGSGLKSSHYVESGIRVVRLQNIGSSEFKNRAAAYIDPKHYATLGDHSVVAGDLLIAGLGDEKIPAGRACAAPVGINPAMVKADCFRFRLRQGFASVQFLAFHLSATAAVAAACLSTGATRLRINLSATASRAVALPPDTEQSEIIEYIGTAVAPLNTAIARTEREIALMQEYRTRLTAEVVTGKLDVRQAATTLPMEEEAAIAPELDEGAESEDAEL